VDAFASAGFEDVRVVGRFDCFAGTTKERTARRYGVIGVNLSAIKLPIGGKDASSGFTRADERHRQTRRSSASG
jgi:hypothetical protein